MNTSRPRIDAIDAIFRLALGALLAIGMSSGIASAQTQFVRGDVNRDRVVEISDAIASLSALFSSGPPPGCQDAADVNDDGLNDIGDPVYLLQFLFSAGPQPGAPYPACGMDPTPDSIDCAVSPCPAAFGSLEVVRTLEWGGVSPGRVRTKALSLVNVGQGPLTIESAAFESGSFSLIETPGLIPPLTLQPGESRGWTLALQAPLDQVGSRFRSTVTLALLGGESRERVVHLDAWVTPEGPTVFESTVVGVAIDPVTDLNCDAPIGEIRFDSTSQATDTYRVRLTDQTGQSLLSDEQPAPDGEAVEPIPALDTCGLADGVIDVRVLVERSGKALAGGFGPSVTKSSAAFPAPTVSPPAEISTSRTVEVCGTAPAGSIVTVTGGARSAGVVLDPTATDFCVSVQLRPNSGHQLFVSAMPSSGTTPRPQSSSGPFSVTQVDPLEVSIVETRELPLDGDQVQALADSGALDIADPTDVEVSLVTVVLQVDCSRVSISQPVAIPEGAGIAFGAAPLFSGSSGAAEVPAHGWIPSSLGSVLEQQLELEADAIGCADGCAQVFVLTTPAGEAIPGVLFIDRRRVAMGDVSRAFVVLSNPSNLFDLVSVEAALRLSGGISHAEIVVPGSSPDASEEALRSQSLGVVLMGESRFAHFPIRADSVGVRSLELELSGFFGGALIVNPVPFSTSAQNFIEVRPPEKFTVRVSSPSEPGVPDVVADEGYELLIELTNESDDVTRYGNIELQLGDSTQLISAEGLTLDESRVAVDFGTLGPGQAGSKSVRLQSLSEGDVIVCVSQSLAGMKLQLDTAPEGSSCVFESTVPVDALPPAGDEVPVVLETRPPPHESSVPIASGLSHFFLPSASCFSADSWDRIVLEPITPGDPAAGERFVTGVVSDLGTAFLEELDSYGNPVRNAPLQLLVEDDASTGITRVTQALGLSSPQLAYTLRPGATYRGTLAGGATGICSVGGEESLLADFVWTFHTALDCPLPKPTTVELGGDLEGSSGASLSASLVLDFANSMDPATLRIDPVDLSSSSVGLFQGGRVIGGDLVGGTALGAVATLSSSGRRLVLQPDGSLPASSVIHVRVTDQLRDVCGSQLELPFGATAQVFSFSTTGIDSTPPIDPLVNDVPSLTNLSSVLVSGQAEPFAQVTVLSSGQPFEGVVTDSGLFAVAIPLNFGTSNTFFVFVTDVSGNSSSVVGLDRDGDPLTTFQDNVPPMVVSVDPAPGAVGVSPTGSFTVEFSEAVSEDSVNSLNFQISGVSITGSFDFDRATARRFTFTPSIPLPERSTLTAVVRANGVRDFAGNGLVEDFSWDFSTITGRPPVIESITPSFGMAGQTIVALIEGSNLGGVVDISIDAPGVEVLDTGIGSSTQREIEIVIEDFASAGTQSLELLTAGGVTSTEFGVFAFQTPPAITAVDPNVVVVGATATIAITGQSLQNVVDVAIDGGGATVVDLGGDQQLREIELSVQPAATVGVRTLTLTTVAGAIEGSIELLPKAIQIPGSSFSPDRTFSIPTLIDRSLPVRLTTPAPAGGVQVAVVSDDPSVFAIEGSVFFEEGEFSSFASGETFGAPGLATITMTAPGYDPATTQVLVYEREINTTSLRLGLGETGDASVRFGSSLPFGGVTFDLTTSDPNVLPLPADPSPTFVGQSSLLSLTGGTESGVAVLALTSTIGGFELGTIVVQVADRWIEAPDQREVPLTGMLEELIALNPDPAPPGGVTIEVSTSDSSTIEVLTPTVFIPEGEFIGVAQLGSLSGVGSATIEYTAPEYLAAQTEIVVTTSLDVVQTFVDVPLSGSSAVYFGLMSGGELFPAPAGGVEVLIEIEDPSCVTAPASIIIPEGVAYGSVLVFHTGTGPCSTSLTATSSFGSIGLPIEVHALPTQAAMTIGRVDGDNLRIGGRLQVKFEGELPSAEHDGVVVQVFSTEPTRALLSDSRFGRGLPVVEVFVPSGENTLSIWVQGEPGDVGSVDLEVRQRQFEPASIALEVVEPSFAYADLDLERVGTPLSFVNDNFALQVGVRDDFGDLIELQELRSRDQLDVTVTSTNPQVGLLTSYFYPDPVPMVGVELFAGQEEAFYSVSLNFTTPAPGGETQIVTSASGFPTRTETVTTVVSPAQLVFEDLFDLDRQIGAGLQAEHSVLLTGSAHGGVTIEIESSDPDRAIVSEASFSVGAATLQIFVPDGQDRVDFWVQAQPGELGPVTLIVTHPLFLPDSKEVEVVSPALRIEQLASEHSGLSGQPIPTDAFRILSGRPDPSLTSIERLQMPAPAQPVVVTVTSTDPTVAQLVSGSQSGASVTAPVSFASNVEVQFEPPMAGVTTIVATAPGFTMIDEAAQDIEVSIFPLTWELTPEQLQIGGGLQVQYEVFLGALDHGGIDATVTSSDPSLALVSLNSPIGAPAAESIQVSVPAGATRFYFRAHALRDVLGSFSLEVSSPGYPSISATQEVVTPFVRVDLPQTEFTFTEQSEIFDRSFQVRSGIIDDEGNFWSQLVNTLAGPWPVTISSSDPSVVELTVLGAPPSPTVELDIEEGSASTPSVPSFGGVSLTFPDPVTGSSDIEVTAPGTGAGSPFFTETVHVEVVPGTMELLANGEDSLVLGSGLQAVARVRLDSVSLGVDVVLTSSHPSLVRFSEGPDSPAEETLVLSFDPLQIERVFRIHAERGVSEVVSVVASSPAHSAESLEVQIVPGVVDIVNLDTTPDFAFGTFPSDSFRLRCGISKDGMTLTDPQEVAGSEPLLVDVTSSDTSVVQVRNSVHLGPDRVTARIEIGESFSFSQGLQVTFDPPTEGVAVIAAETPGFVSGFPTASRQVVLEADLEPIGIDDLGDGFRVGAGLQTRYRLMLREFDHGGSWVRIESSHPQRARVSRFDDVIGTPFIDVFIPAGSYWRDFFVQGVSGATGTVDLIATSPQLGGEGRATITVEPPALRVYLSGSSDFSIGVTRRLNFQVGLLNDQGLYLGSFQEVSAAGPLFVACSTDPVGVFALEFEGVTGPLVTLEIPVGSAGLFGPWVEAIGFGTGSVTVDAVGFDPNPNSTWTGRVLP